MPKPKTAGAAAAKSPKGHHYGWVPDLPDQRDILFGAVRAVPATLPPSVDLRDRCSAVEDQGPLNSCTGSALVGALEFLERKDKVRVVNLSRLFIYYNGRVIEHTIASDNGAMLRDGVKTLAHQGVCTEAKWPYAPAKVATPPTPACYEDAARHQIRSYYRVVTLDQMRTCLADGFPFVFGFAAYESFESQRVAETGVVHMPQPGERAVGGHAVLAVGYDDEERRFLVRNSWGEGWGIKGYFTMPYNYLANRNLSDDFWTIRRAERI